MAAHITELEQNVTKIDLGDRSIIIVGTAHISQSSAELAERIIREQKPDAVAVELCSSRYQSLRDPDRWKKTDLVSVLKEGRAYVLFTQLMLASFQKKMGDQLKVKPGLEMMVAIKTAEELSIPVILADREIKTTLRRAWAAVGTWSLIKIFFSSLWASIWSPKIDEAEIELLKTGDALEALLEEFSDTLPDVKEPLINERDLYLASTIRDSAYKTVVAIVGAGHVPGIKTNIDLPIDRHSLEIIPPPSTASKVFGWGIPGLISLLIIAGFFTSGASTTLEMAKYWAIYTGIAAGVGSLICLAHPLTILSAAVAAPFTTLHPLLAAGWVAGLVEALIRKPTVQDLETITDDITSLKGLWSNRVARVFLIMIVTNLTTTVGMIWGTKIVAHLL